MKSSLNEVLNDLIKRTNKDYIGDFNRFTSDEYLSSRNSYLRLESYANELCNLLRDSTEFKFDTWKVELGKILSDYLDLDQKELEVQREGLKNIEGERKEDEDEYQCEGKILHKNPDLGSRTKSYIQIFENRINILNRVMEKDCADLDAVLKLAVSLGVDPENIIVDPFLARGLNYYTGTIFEVEFDDYKELGSVCSGGRYENLVSNFAQNRKLPGVGMSVGISRIFPKLLEIGAVEATEYTIADVLITTQNKELKDYYLRVVKNLREEGIKTDIYLMDKALGNQMKYASKCGFKFVVIADKGEAENNSCILKDMESGNQEVVKLDELANNIRAKLDNPALTLEEKLQKTNEDIRKLEEKKGKLEKEEEARKNI